MAEFMAYGIMGGLIFVVALVLWRFVCVFE